VRFRLQQGVARAELRFLQCKPQAQPFPERLPHPLRTVADNHNDRRVLKRVGRAQHVLDQWETAGRMQHLRLLGLHPGPLAGGEDDDVNVGHM
jgi:hypothetical protein